MRGHGHSGRSSADKVQKSQRDLRFIDAIMSVLEIQVRARGSQIETLQDTVLRELARAAHDAFNEGVECAEPAFDDLPESHVARLEYAVRAVLLALVRNKSRLRAEIAEAMRGLHAIGAASDEQLARAEALGGRTARRFEDLDAETLAALAAAEVPAEFAHLDALNLRGEIEAAEKEGGCFTSDGVRRAALDAAESLEMAQASLEPREPSARTRAAAKRHHGSNLESLLAEDGNLEGAHLEAAAKIAEAVKQNGRPACPKCSAPMHRGVRPMTIEHKGERLTFDLPGWYCGDCGESIHSGEDMQTSDAAVAALRPVIAEGLAEIEAGRVSAFDPLEIVRMAQNPTPEERAKRIVEAFSGQTFSETGDAEAWLERQITKAIEAAVKAALERQT